LFGDIAANQDAPTDDRSPASRRVGVDAAVKAPGPERGSRELGVDSEVGGATEQRVDNDLR